MVRHFAGHRERGFISVGAVGQRSLQVFSFLMVLACSSLREFAVFAVYCVRGIKSSVLRRMGTATRRFNSSLRSHRTWRSQCRRVWSGLN